MSATTGDDGLSWRQRALADGERERWDAEAIGWALARRDGPAERTCDCLVGLDLRVFDAMAQIIRHTCDADPRIAALESRQGFGLLLSGHANVGLARVVGPAPPGPRVERRESKFALVEMLSERIGPNAGRRAQVEVAVDLDADLLGRLDAIFDGILSGSEDRWLLEHRDALRSVVVEVGLRTRAILTGHLPHEIHPPPRGTGAPPWRRRPS